MPGTRHRSTFAMRVLVLAGCYVGLGCNSDARTPPVSKSSKPSTATQAAGSGSSAESGSGNVTSEQLIADGEVLYKRYCALCHGKDGAGYAADHANQLSNPLFVASATKDLIWFGIEYGRPGTPMAAFGKSQGGPLEELQIKSIVTYIQSFAQAQPSLQPVPGDPIVGTKLYAAHCAACHGPNGEGKTATSLTNPYFLISANDDFLRYAIKYGRPDTPMAPFQKVLSEQEISDVVAFLRSFARNVKFGPTAGEPIPSLSDIVINPKGQPARLVPRDGHYVAAEQVDRQLRDGSRMVLLDARATSDWMNAHIPGAYPAPFYDPLSPDLLAALPRDGTPLVAYCACPHAASDQVAEKLESAGFKNVFVIEEGVLIWAKRGYAMTFGRKMQPSSR